MRPIIVIISFLLLTNVCGAYQDADAVPYIQDFEQTYNLDTNMIEVQIVEDGFKPAEVGICYSNSLNKKLIVIKASYFYSVSESLKKVLIFHELGHCAMDKWIHDNHYYSDSCPVSIMNSHIMKESCFFKHYKELIRSLGEP